MDLGDLECVLWTHPRWISCYVHVHGLLCASPSGQPGAMEGPCRLEEPLSV